MHRADTGKAELLENLMLPISQQPLLSHPLQKMLISGLTQPLNSQTVSKGDAPQFGKPSGRIWRGNAGSRWQVLCPFSIPQNRGTLMDTLRSTKCSLGSLLAVEDLRSTILVVEKKLPLRKTVSGWCILMSGRQADEKAVNENGVTGVGRNVVLLPCCTTHSSPNRHLSRIKGFCYIPLQAGSLLSTKGNLAITIQHRTKQINSR